MKAAAAFAAGGVIGITLLALAVHFGDTRNRAGLGVTGGAFLALITAAEACLRVARKRVTGTYSCNPARTERAWRRRQG